MISNACDKNTFTDIESLGQASMDEKVRVACLGAGLIGRSWAALFVAAGHPVAIYDPDPRARTRVRETIESTWPVLQQIGLAKTAAPVADVAVYIDARVAVADAAFIQESVPERIGIKHALYGAIEPVLGADAIVASSASGLTLGELQAGWRDPSRLVLGHPFNPPHLIPLVEVMGNGRTAAGVVDRARRFYEAAGKVTIEVKREVPGHVANRLQAALWREAIHLVLTGVASIQDMDSAVAAGPGIRWAAMGPTTLFHLGGDDGGLADFCAHYADSFNRWWEDLGTPRLDAATIATLVSDYEQSPHADMDSLVQRRDRLIATLVAAKNANTNS